MTDNAKVCSNLNDLLETNYDARNGFNNAADDCDNTRLATFFRNKANQRDRFASEIKSEIVRLGGTPSEYGSVAGFMHRAWMDVKTAFSTDNEEAVLEACETGEKAALKEYDEFLSENTVSSLTRTMLERQRNEVIKTHGEVKNMEERYDG